MKKLEEITVYILPCVNPDGVDICLTKQISMRSGFFPIDPDTPNALVPTDLDGDGRILQMRWKDPNGMWKDGAGCESIMVPRLPHDTEGPFYQMHTEGTVENYDRSGKIKAPQGYDLNRQFPPDWSNPANEGHPGCFTESRTLMEFLTNHQNIFSVFDFHCGTRAMMFYLPENLPGANLVRRMMKLGKEITGMEIVRDGDYARQENHPPLTLSGTFCGYACHIFGIMSATIELGFGWDSIGMTPKEIWNAPDGFFEEKSVAKIVALHKKNGSVISAPWVKYNHPQLGEVEIGGRLFGNSGLMLAKDMNTVIPKVIDFLREIMNWHPRIEIADVEKEVLGENVVRVRADIINTGKMPTFIVNGSCTCNAHLPVRISIEGAEKILSRTETELGQLDVLQSKQIEWFVEAKTGTKLKVLAAHPRAGVTMVELTV